MCKDLSFNFSFKSFIFNSVLSSFTLDFLPYDVLTIFPQEQGKYYKVFSNSHMQCLYRLEPAAKFSSYCK